MVPTRSSRGRRARVGRVLRDVLGGDDPAQGNRDTDPEVLEMPELVQAGRYHRVLPALYVAFRGIPLPAATGRALTEEHHVQVMHHMQILADLAQLGALIDGVGCRWAVVKGPYLAEVVHHRPDLRSYGDLDVVVDRRCLPAVAAALDGAGAEFLDRNWTLIRDEGRAQTSLLLPRRTSLDLHWHLLNRASIRTAFSLDMDDILSRAQPRLLGSVTAPVLDDVDALIHLCLHGALSGASKLVWLFDVHAAFTNLHPDPLTLVERSQANGSALAVAVMLERTRQALGTQVSDDLLDALAPRGAWRRASAAAGVIRPVAANVGHAGTGRTLIRATRADGRSSLAEFRRTARRNAWARMTHDTSHPGLGDGMAHQLQEPHGTEQDRDRLFASVAAAP